jgi:hypothetical protein
MTLDYLGKVIGDLIKHEDSHIVTRDVRTLTNGTQAAISLDIGAPIIVSSATACGECAAASVNTANAILLTKVTDLAAGASIDVVLLRRGPAAIDFAALEDTDYVAAAITMATYVTAIEALGIVVRYEPDNIERQTT